MAPTLDNNVHYDDVYRHDHDHDMDYLNEVKTWKSSRKTTSTFLKCVNLCPLTKVCMQMIKLASF